VFSSCVNCRVRIEDDLKCSAAFTLLVQMFRLPEAQKNQARVSSETRAQCSCVTFLDLEALKDEQQTTVKLPYSCLSGLNQMYRSFALAVLALG
jgi:hypothetical protein